MKIFSFRDRKHERLEPDTSLSFASRIFLREERRAVQHYFDALTLAHQSNGWSIVCFILTFTNLSICIVRQRNNVFLPSSLLRSHSHWESLRWNYARQSESVSRRTISFSDHFLHHDRSSSGHALQRCVCPMFESDSTASSFTIEYYYWLSCSQARSGETIARTRARWCTRTGNVSWAWKCARDAHHRSRLVKIALTLLLSFMPCQYFTIVLHVNQSETFLFTVCVTMSSFLVVFRLFFCVSVYWLEKNNRRRNWMRRIATIIDKIDSRGVIYTFDQWTARMSAAVFSVTRAVFAQACQTRRREDQLRFLVSQKTNPHGHIVLFLF